MEKDGENKPYKLWMGDQYTCPECGQSTLLNFGLSAFSHRPSMQEVWEAAKTDGLVIERGTIIKNEVVT